MAQNRMAILPGSLPQETPRSFPSGGNSETITRSQTVDRGLALWSQDGKLLKAFVLAIAERLNIFVSESPWSCGLAESRGIACCQSLDLIVGKRSWCAWPT